MVINNGIIYVMKTVELLAEPANNELTNVDQSWLANFGVDPSLQEDPAILKELSLLIAVGSQHINDEDNETQHLEIVQARQSFFEFVGIEQKTLENIRKTRPTFIPIDTFINTQTVMNSLGIDAIKIINKWPSAIDLAADKVKNTVANFAYLGLDPVAIIYWYPSALSLAPETVIEKVANFNALGLDAVKIINKTPSVIGLALETVREKVTNFTNMGLDATTVINAFPSVLSLANETILDKVANFNALGLDAVKIINKTPSVIGLGAESIREKVVLLNRTVRVLKWEYTTKDLVENYPAILGFNAKKLRILRRIAATYLAEDIRSMEPQTLKSGLITPLEKYILSIPRIEQIEPIKNTSSDLLTRTRKLKYAAADRQQRALDIAKTGNIGHIGSMYLDYKKKTA
jgi:hypothetical protein